PRRSERTVSYHQRARGTVSLEHGCRPGAALHHPALAGLQAPARHPDRRRASASGLHRMTSVTVGFAGLAILFTLIGFGMPIGFAMGLIGFAGFTVLVSFDTAIVRIGVTTFSMATNHAMGTVPLFL